MPLPKSKFQGPRRGGSYSPAKLVLCRGCNRFIYPDAELCHFCGAEVQSVNEAFYQKLIAARQAALQVDLILRRMQRERDRQRALESEER